jgi:hypothetical protein
MTRAILAGADGEADEPQRQATSAAAHVSPPKP